MMIALFQNFNHYAIPTTEWKVVKASKAEKRMILGLESNLAVRQLVGNTFTKSGCDEIKKEMEPHLLICKKF